MNKIFNKKIKILRVITQAEVVPWHLKNFIDRSENDYQLFITGNNVSRYDAEYPHVTFIDNEILRKVSPFKDFIAFVKLVLTCIRIKPDIIHSIMPKAGLLSSIAGLVSLVPIRVHTYTGQVWATKSGLSRRIYVLLDKLVLKLSTRCLTDSPSQSRFLAKNGLLENGKPIHYLGKGSLSGVALNRFNIDILKERSALRSQLGLRDEDFVYIFLARKSIVKGIKELFESFDRVSSLPNVKLLFIGPDESDGYLDELFKKFNHLSDQIISLDIVKTHEKYLALSDVLCLPSSSEGFGTIVIEAAALGIPSIGFSIVGLTDAIEHDTTGILIPYKNVIEFSAAMEDLYTNREKLNVMRVRARERVLQYFSADAVYKFQNDFYRSLLQDLNYIQ